MSRVALAIWVKTPGRSPVKTRLGSVIGTLRAERIYEACVEASAAIAEAAAAIDAALVPMWAVAESDALDEARWQSLRRVAQGEGDLGERLARVHVALAAEFEAILFMGADTPQATPLQIVEAAQELRNASTDFLLGNAADGGFWLFGARRPLPAEAWTGVVYSRHDTAATLTGQLARHGRVAFVETLHDLDRPEDMATLANAIALLPTPLAEQRRVLELISG